MSTSKFLNTFLRNRLFTHFLYWIVVVLLLSYYGSLFGSAFRNNLINMLTLLPVQMAAAYLLVYFQIPRWLFTGSWLKFILSLVLIVYLMAILARLAVIHIAEPIIGMEGFDETLWEIIRDPVYLLRVYVTIVFLPAIILFLIKMTKERFIQQNQLDKLEKEKSSAELRFLKAQMNPHFLFNTLNNIYSLAKNNAPQTSEMILKLSEILDHTIYESSEFRVPVQKEWTLIENYVDLEALRHSDQLTIVLDHDIDPADAQIAPLILIAFVENAFKYALKSATEVSKIKISLRVKQNILTFQVFNTKSKNSRLEDTNKKGIGVKNVNRQLELQYPNRHEIETEDHSESYNINLKIQL